MPKPKQPYVSGHFIMGQLDYWIDDIANKRSMEFSEEARKNGRVEIKHFQSVYELQMWRDFNGLADEPLEQLVDRA